MLLSKTQLQANYLLYFTFKIVKLELQITFITCCRLKWIIVSWPNVIPRVRGGLMVSMLDCKSKVLGFKSRPGQKFGSRFLLHQCPLANSARMSTVCCRREDETAMQRTGHPPSYAEAKKIKSLTLQTHSCPRASLRDCSFILLLAQF